VVFDTEKSAIKFKKLSFINFQILLITKEKNFATWKNEPDRIKNLLKLRTQYNWKLL